VINIRKDFMNLEEEEKNKDEFIKVTISKKAEKAATDLLAKVNDGFDGGRINRQDLMSWILTMFAEDCGEQDIRAIRAAHFDEITLLELCLKKSKQSGSLPPELRKLLLAQAGLDDSGKKSVKKAIDSRVNQ